MNGSAYLPPSSAIGNWACEFKEASRGLSGGGADVSVEATTPSGGRTPLPKQPAHFGSFDSDCRRLNHSMARQPQLQVAPDVPPFSGENRVHHRVAHRAVLARQLMAQHAVLLRPNPSIALVDLQCDDGISTQGAAYRKQGGGGSRG